MHATERTCPPNEYLELWAKDRGGDDAIARHVEGCAACAAALDALDEDDRFLRRVASAAADARGTPEASLLSGDAIPGFEILGELHRGGQGVVYKAYDLEAHRFVAIKALLQGVFSTPRQRQRFEREIEIIAGLRHPNIVTLYQTSELLGDRIAYVMEFIDGKPLDRWAERRFPRGSAGDPATIRTKLELFVKICDAIGYAHEHGVVHRDLKPGNILIDRGDAPQVVDFGLARTMGRELATVTVTGEIMGTFAYAAPEQMSGDPAAVDTRTDVYALGGLLYELLTGELPFRTDGSVPDLVARITAGDPTPPSKHLPGLGDELETIILKALARDPARRYAFAGALGADVRRYLAHEPIDAKRDSTWYILRKTMRRHRAPVAIAAALIMLLTVVAVFMTIQARNMTSQRDAANAALWASRLEHARALALTEGSHVGEARLWELHLNGLPPAEARRQPGPTDTYWALWEWYARNACRGTVETAPSARAVMDMDQTGRFVAVGGEGPIAVWRIESNELVAELPTAVATCALRFVPVAETLVVVGEDGTVEHWNWRQATRIASGRLSGFQIASLSTVDLDAGGKVVAAGAADGMIRLWDAADCRPRGQWQAHDSSISSIALSPDGMRVATCTAGDAQGIKRCRVWDVRTHRQLAETTSSGPFLTVPNFAPDGRSLVLARSADVMRWSFDAGLEPVVLYAHDGRVLSIRPSPDGRFISSTATDLTVRLWDVVAGKLQASFVGHRDAPWCLAIAGDRPTVATADMEGAVKFWDVAPHPHYTALRAHSTSVHAALFSPTDDSTLVSASPGELMIWSLTSLGSPVIHRDLPGVSSIAFTADGSRVATGSRDGRLRLWRTDTWEVVASIDAGQQDGVNTIDVSPDGRFGVVPGDNGTIRVWDLRSGQLVQVLRGHTGRVPSARFCPTDPEMIASAGMDGTIRFWRWRTGQCTTVEAHAGGARVVRFSPDGRTLASGGRDALVKLWDPRRAVCTAVLAEHQDEVFCIAFSHDGLLATGGRGGVVKVWDAASGDCLLTFDEPGEMVFTVDFSGDGRTLVAGSSDTIVGMWDLSYFDRHIAGNLDDQARRLEATSGEPVAAASLRQWATRVIEGGDRRMTRE